MKALLNFTKALQKTLHVHMFLKAENFKMIILQVTGVFEIHVHFDIIISKREQMFLNYTFSIK